MKIKTDFVTNSSSTSFLFVFRGSSIDNLYKAMKDNWKWFEYTSSDGKIVNVYDIINYKDFGDRTIIPIDDKIIEIQKDLKSMERFIKNNPKSNLKYEREEIQKLEILLETLKHKKKKGFQTTSELDFSNHDFIGSVVSDNLVDIDNSNLSVINLGYSG